MFYIRKKQFDDKTHRKNKNDLFPAWHPIRDPIIVWSFTRSVVTFCGRTIKIPDDRYEIKQMEPDVYDRERDCYLCNDVLENPRRLWTKKVTGV